MLGACKRYTGPPGGDQPGGPVFIVPCAWHVMEVRLQNGCAVRKAAAPSAKRLRRPQSGCAAVSNPPYHCG